jgi:hypothetical protein
VYSDFIIDRLETDFGTSILSDLTDQRLTRNGQPVRLFDETKHSSEQYYRSDKKGKPYIQNWQEGKRWYPFTAYCKAHGIDTATAIKELCQQYGLSDNQPGYVPRRPYTPPPPPAPVAAPIIPAELYEPCRSQFARNGLFLYLTKLFGHEQAVSVFEQYRLGTSKHWRYMDSGTLTTCLPQFDVKGQLRQVKIMLFHPQTGRRAKKEDTAHRWNSRTRQYEVERHDKVSFIGKTLLGGGNSDLVQCYFGEHLLGLFPGFKVALVEGESTALVMSVVWPEYVWLATGGATGGGWDDTDKFSVLRSRNVVLFPDSGKFNEWSHRAEALQAIAESLTVSRYMEANAPAPNLDLRDLLPTLAESDEQPVVTTLAEWRPGTILRPDPTQLEYL